MTESPIPTAIRIAQVVGITSAAFLSGLISSVSLLTVPAIATAPPSLKSQQWATMYAIGASTAPPIAIVSSLAFSYLASQVPKAPALLKHTILNTDQTFYLYTAAAILVPAIVPWTLGVMGGTNDKLHEKAEMDSEMKEDLELDNLISRWKVLNLGRAVFPALAAVLGLWTVVS